jgi:hypothetical protein
MPYTCQVIEYGTVLSTSRLVCAKIDRSGEARPIGLTNPVIKIGGVHSARRRLGAEPKIPSHDSCQHSTVQ